MRFLFASLFVALVFSMVPRPVAAQDGQLIEGLFRTWAATQAEKERRKAAEAEARLQEARRVEQAARPAGNALPNPYEVRLPSGFRTAKPGNSITGPATPRPGGRQINVRSQAAADYASQLIQFDSDYDRLLRELRQASAGSTAIRSVLPAAYEVSASSDQILGRLNGLSDLSVIESAHRRMESRYRDVSYRVGAIDGLSRSCRDLIERCDRTCSAMRGPWGQRVAFDRAGVAELLITAATYMQALSDDLELMTMDRSRCRSMQHQCRLLRQRLLSAQREIPTMSYDSCVSRFSDFIQSWEQFSSQVYAIGDPYLSRRLDRIGQCKDQTYELLRIPPPTSGVGIADIARRLNDDMEQISKSLTFFALAQLPREQQTQVVNTMNEISRLASQLERLAADQSSRRGMTSTFLMLDQAWCGIRPILSEVRSLRPGLIAETERGCQRLRQIFGVGADGAADVHFSQLVSVAAAMEGTSEELRRTLNGYQRYLNPSSYRRSVIDSMNGFHRHSRDVHELLSRTERLGDRGHLSKLAEEAEALLSDWNSLSAKLNELESRGLTGSRAVKVRRLQQELVYPVGQVAAALVGR